MKGIFLTDVLKHNNGIKGDGKKPPRLMPSVSLLYIFYNSHCKYIFVLLIHKNYISFVLKLIFFAW